MASIRPFLTLNMEDIPPTTIAPTPTYLIFVDHKWDAPSNGFKVNSEPSPRSGIPISQPTKPPIKISIAIFSLTIKPTASKAGEISPPKKKILFPIIVAYSNTPFNIPKNEIRILNAPPIPAPFITRLAFAELSLPSPLQELRHKQDPQGILDYPHSLQ